jgi:hypothetical protein
MGTFIDKLTPVKYLRPAIPIAVICFLICIVYSVKSLFIMLEAHTCVVHIFHAVSQPTADQQLATVRKIRPGLQKAIKHYKPTAYIVRYSFMLGMCAIAAFVIANMMR